MQNVSKYQIKKKINNKHFQVSTPLTFVAAVSKKIDVN